MSPDLLASIVDQVNNSNVLLHRHISRPTRRSKPFEPIRYNSMRGWMVLNYTVVVAFLLLLGLGITYLMKVVQ